MFKRSQVIQWNILEKDTVDEIIFRTINPRNRIMLELMSRAGMRISEVLKLTPNDINGRKITLRHPKSGKDKELVYIPQRLCNRLEEYILITGLMKNERIFPISYATARDMVGKAGKILNVLLRPHDLRRFAATYASRSGTPIETVREEVIDKLIMNYSHGKLSYEAFERRLDTAMESQSNVEIAALADDLEMDVDESYTDNKKRGFSYQFEPGHTEDVDYIVNVFSGANRSGTWNVAKEIRVLSIFSGSDIDFSHARFTHPRVTIKLFSLFSGDNIYIPEDVNVISKAFCVFGSVDNTAPSSNNVNAPTIIVEGLSIFSGIDIKIKRTIKERFVAFADSMRNMFN